MKAAVLLAEDEPVSRSFLHEALQSLGYHCEAVADGTSALRRAQEHAFDLLLLDVNLPELSGPELLARLRLSPAAASRLAPAIALTADHDTRLRQRLRDSGFAAVGSKPIGMQTLAALLDAVLQCREPASVPPLELAPWDDAAALRAVGGKLEIVTALRALMQQELPAQRATILAALERSDWLAARGELHRMRAACGFCGAAELAGAVDALHDSLAAGRAEPKAREHWCASIDRLLPMASR